MKHRFKRKGVLGFLLKHVNVKYLMVMVRFGLNHFGTERFENIVVGMNKFGGGIEVDDARCICIQQFFLVYGEDAIGT
jgi:hypothetical protein